MSYGSLVDPSFELLDPCPDIHALFIQFDKRFFGGALACCEVKWSPRMYSCAGICSYEIRGGRGGLCSIRLSKPLLSLRPRKDLVETLLHEMIHAFLFVKERNRDRDGHGPQFQAHMHRINQSGGTSISIYHSFHDEVRLYKQHWWRCTGPCKDKRPFFGYVKRSSNRAPGPNDKWWKQHQNSCGGNFDKVKEPEGYGQKKTKKTTAAGVGKSAKKQVTPPQKTLDDFFKKPGVSPKKSPKKSSPPSINVFGGGGQKLGGTATSSTLLNKFSSVTSGPGHGPGTTENCRSSRLLFPPVSSQPSVPQPDIEVITLDEDDSEDFFVDADDAMEISFFVSSSLVMCPSCNEEIEEKFIHGHLDICLA